MTLARLKLFFKQKKLERKKAFTTQLSIFNHQNLFLMHCTNSILVNVINLIKISFKVITCYRKKN